MGSGAVGLPAAAGSSSCCTAPHHTARPRAGPGRCRCRRTSAGGAHDGHVPLLSGCGVGAGCQRRSIDGNSLAVSPFTYNCNRLLRVGWRARATLQRRASSVLIQSSYLTPLCFQKHGLLASYPIYCGLPSETGKKGRVVRGKRRYDTRKQRSSWVKTGSKRNLASFAIH